jgi:hypothetical protein
MAAGAQMEGAARGEEREVGVGIRFRKGQRAIELPLANLVALVARLHMVDLDPDAAVAWHTLTAAVARAVVRPLRSVATMILESASAVSVRSLGSRPRDGGAKGQWRTGMPA